MNIKYLGYNLIRTDYKKLFDYVNKLSEIEKINKLGVYIDILKCLIKYDTRFLDYFYFRFFNKDEDRSIHTNVWDMHLFHKKYNSSNSIIFRDKLKFRKRFEKYFNYPYFELTNLEDIDNLVAWIEVLNLKQIVAKEPLGTVGSGVLILEVKRIKGQLFIDDVQVEIFLKTIFNDGFTLFETFIVQNEVLASIYPKSINTIRIVTFLNRGNVEIWGALLRMGYDKSVDNFDAGGLSAKVNLDNGIISSGAKFKNPFDNTIYSNHPITNNIIKGIEIPYWSEVILMIKSAALEVTDVKTVGWDVAITDKGPTLIEGNDNWDKTHFELISGIGLNNRIKELLKHEI